MALDVYLTNACDLRCKFCFNLEREDAPKIGFEDICEILTAAYSRGHRYVSITGGEPFIYKRVMEVIEHAHELGYWVNILSHGGLLDEEKVARLKEFWRLRIRISLDGPEAETHDALRGQGTFDNTMNKIRLLISRGVTVGIGVTVSEYNVNRVDEVIRFALDNGISFIRFTPVVRVKLGKRAKVHSSLHEKILRTIIDCTIKYRQYMDLPSDLPSDVSFPIDSLTTKRCMAGKLFYGITPDKRILSCPLIDEHDKVPTTYFKNADSFGELTTQMDALFEDIKPRLQGICNTCEFKDVCYGGCLAEKLSFDRDLAGEQPVCTKLILEKLIGEYDREQLNAIVNSWIYKHRNSLEFSESNGCMRQAPFWNINFKRESAWTDTNLRYA